MFKNLYCSPSSPSDISRKVAENKENNGTVRALSVKGHSCSTCSYFKLSHCKKKDKPVKSYNICHLHSAS